MHSNYVSDHHTFIKLSSAIYSISQIKVSLQMCGLICTSKAKVSLQNLERLHIYKGILDLMELNNVYIYFLKNKLHVYIYDFEVAIQIPLFHHITCNFSTRISLATF